MISEKTINIVKESMSSEATFGTLLGRASTASRQLAVIDIANKIISQSDALVYRSAPLAEGIIDTVRRSVRQYGENAHPMSEKQIAAVARDVVARFATIELA